MHTHKGRLYRGTLRDYFEANSKVLVIALDDLDFEVTTTVATHNTPGVKPVIVTGLLAVEEDVLDVNTTALSAFFFTDTSIVTPSFGKVELIFALMATEVPTTANTLL